MSLPFLRICRVQFCSRSRLLLHGTSKSRSLSVTGKCLHKAKPLPPATQNGLKNESAAAATATAPDLEALQAYVRGLNVESQSKVDPALYQAAAPLANRSSATRAAQSRKTKRATEFSALEQGLSKRDAEKVWEAFNSMISSPLEYKLTAKHYGRMIQIFSRDPKTASARCNEVLNSMARVGVKFTSTRDYNSLITWHSRSGNFDQAKAILAEMGMNGVSPDVHTYNIIMNAVGRESPESAFQVYQRMIKQDILPDLVTYNTLLKVCKQKGDIELLTKVYNILLEDEGVEPDVVTYSILIDAHSKRRNLGTAQTIYREMLANGVAPDLVTFNNLLDGFAKSLDVDQAMALYKEMLDLDIKPNVITFSILINMRAKFGQMEEAMKMYSEMMQQELTPNVFTYTTLIDGFVKTNDIEKAAAIYQEMLDANISPNVVTYSTLIHAYSKSGLVSQAMDLFQDMLTNRVYPDAVTYNTLIDAHMKTSNLESAQRMYKDMLSLNVAPDVVTYSIMIKGYVKAEQLDLAKALVEQMKKSSIEPNPDLQKFLKCHGLSDG
ncbi:TPR-like protein [Basidiobolus meristosporus CBS 931.73]|uniref:TPR-like protein n=1 Tax=Basidiobolus meristosporus CBS 931.73 TaxID=1314790 RepID=A0A1Y1Y2B6_9FUNG|nr:TPR-like protein [Basidiobolus meristosporus CBS 931.73]|eukprot:ORX92157.1 TPR-like protein [Basidiobolus meristosporus CBS 931.73]